MPTLERAIEIAARHHAGQCDKAGAAYVLHPLRMMLRFVEPRAQIVAVLHDVVEDTSLTLGDLRREGFTAEIVAAVDGLTRRTDESYDAFIERAGRDPLARRVKLADLEDNMNLLRIAEPTAADLERLARYHRAWRRLRALDEKNARHSI